METQLALIADSANVSVEGKLNILGEFDSIFAGSEPATHPVVWLVVKLLFDETDVGQHKLLLRLVDDDGNTLLPPITGDLTVAPPGPGYSGDRQSMPVILCARNLTLPRFGRYSFELRVDDHIVADVPLYLRKLQASTPEA